ncbi:MAG: GLUG motif-containing protein [Bacteroidota bacterium]
MVRILGLCMSLYLASYLYPAWASKQEETSKNPEELEQGHVTLICTAVDLASIGHKTEFPLDGTYRLESDIDLTGVKLRPIGDVKKPFQGKIYGNSYTITQLYISHSDDNAGLFGMLAKGALVQDLYLEIGTVEGKSRVGLLVGWNQGTIRDCYATGNVQGIDNIGGLVGMNDEDGQLVNCQACCQVLGVRHEVGGLVGCNRGYIIDGRAQGVVKGTRLVGGCVGTNDEGGQLIHCMALGKVIGKYWVGGLVGHNWFRGQVIHCMAAVEAIGEAYVGGLAGFNYAEAIIARSVATGPVTGDTYTGVFVGSSRGTITYGPKVQESRWSNRPQKSTLRLPPRF